ncbi:hypothetical protein Bca52824_058356 [Brassica carinata]|uniref:Uncharacterized protein n=1 Tax=Brassica carinata TaxID=52824 RepID=A0A8X7QTC5_BRACI|nr:hypothetical protein Bca52824_058356 [Brassica carinata]
MGELSGEQGSLNVIVRVWGKSSLFLFGKLCLAYFLHRFFQRRGEARYRLSMASIRRLKRQKQRPSYTPPPRLARAALSANGPSSTSSTSVEVGPDRDPLVDAHRD